LEDDPRALVVPTGIDNLFALPSGPIPPNPSELLNSDVFSRMGRELLESGYDHLVFDSPPMLSVSDAVIIASTVDVTILVVRASHTARQSVRVAAERLRQAGAGSTGVVLNNLDPTNARGYGRYYYTYRYGEPPEEAADGAPAEPRAGDSRASA
jgi:capsular exopolysaccharide synthesis family protein